VTAVREVAVSVRSLTVLQVTEDAEVVLQVAPAGPVLAGEQLAVTLDGAPVRLRLLPGEHGGRQHLLRCGVGELRIDYAGTVPAVPVEQVHDRARVTEVERVVGLRPSRYCPSDRLVALAERTFRGVGDDRERAAAVGEHVRRSLAYVPGSSRPTTDAIDTLLAGEGVCRDFAHVVVAHCRALLLPARLVSVYAPGLAPMDFHAVAEVAVDGSWQVLDPTGLAPRRGLVRIATGRDAADTAFITVTRGGADLVASVVTAVTEGDLPEDDGSPVALG